jgi:hypothetical protein
VVVKVTAGGINAILGSDSLSSRHGLASYFGLGELQAAGRGHAGAEIGSSAAGPRQLQRGVGRRFVFLPLASFFVERGSDADLAFEEDTLPVPADTVFAAMCRGNRAPCRRQSILPRGKGTSRKKASRNPDGSVAAGISSFSCFDNSPQ